MYRHCILFAIIYISDFYNVGYLPMWRNDKISNLPKNKYKNMFLEAGD